MCKAVRIRKYVSLAEFVFDQIRIHNSVYLLNLEYHGLPKIFYVDCRA
jgi:hypothetical protein